VAVGDINNDGLEDIYFASNLTKNRLYLNKGNFRFKDITDEAGVAVLEHGAPVYPWLMLMETDSLIYMSVLQQMAEPNTGKTSSI